MRIRDGKLEGINPDGTLVHLTKEMIRIAKVHQIELETQLYSLNKQKHIKKIISFYSSRSFNGKNKLDSELNKSKVSKSVYKLFAEQNVASNRTRYDAFMK